MDCEMMQLLDAVHEALRLPAPEALQACRALVARYRPERPAAPVSEVKVPPEHADSTDWIEPLRQQVEGERDAS